MMNEGNKGTMIAVIVAFLFAAGCRKATEEVSSPNDRNENSEAGGGMSQMVEDVSPLIGDDRLLPWEPVIADRVAALLGKSAYKVTAKELSEIRVLNLDSIRLKNLRGFELFTGLEELSAKGGEVSDLAPLSGLTQLTSVKLSNNKVSDLAPLAQLENLTLLELDDNEIESLQPLSSLANLQQLFASGNIIRDLAPLTGCESLAHLSVAYNQVEEFPDFGDSPKLLTADCTFNNLEVAKGSISKDNIDKVRRRTRVRYVPQCDPLLGDGFLETAVRAALSKPWSALSEADLSVCQELQLSKAKVRNLDSLGFFTDLKSLSFNMVKVEDLSFLAGLRSLEKLEIVGEGFRESENIAGKGKVLDLSLLENLPNLKSLAIKELRIDNAEALSSLEGLETFVADGTNLDEISFLQSFQGLKLLRLNRVPVRAGGVIAGLEHLEALNLNNSDFDSYDFLGSHPNLTKLQLQGAPISNLAFLSGMKSLKFLNLNGTSCSDFEGLLTQETLNSFFASGTAFTDLSLLKNNLGLVTLRASGNTLEDVTPLRGFRKLAYVDLSRNKIQDASPLTACTRLTRVDLRGNPLKKENMVPSASRQVLLPPHL